MKIEFFAQGDPKGQPRPRAFARAGRARVFDPGTAEGWKSQIALAAREYIPAEPITRPVGVCLYFYFSRPKSHFGSGKNSDKIKDSAPKYHTAKPDADNLAKAVLDALTTLGFWGDDAQIVHLTVQKSWAFGEGWRPGCLVTIKDNA